MNERILSVATGLVVAIILLVMPILTEGGSDHGNSINIRLQQAQFDPLAESPRLPAQLVARQHEAADNPYYLVQFDGPVQREWRTQIDRAGAEVMDYVPDFAFVVRAGDQARAGIAAHPHVRWIGAYQPAFRLSNELFQFIDKPRAGFGVELVVRTFPGEPAARWQPQLESLNVTIIDLAEDSGGGTIAVVLAPETAIVELAHVPALAWIEPRLEPELFNEISRSNLIMGQDQIEAVLGLFGNNQVVAVGDTGLSTGNPATVHQDFSGRVIGGTWGPGNCGTWADNHSHGTHVAGSVLGSGAASGADIPGQIYAGSNAGIAPEAELYVWSFCNNFSGLPDAPYTDYYLAMYNQNLRLRINTNSWGYTTGHGGYNTFTRETDRFVWDHAEMVLTYAAGNSGTDSNASGVVNPGSMSMPGTAKNIITVGASENLRLSGGLNPGGPCSTWGSCWPGDFPANPINSDRASDHIDGMAAFSGRGPTLSGRIKPDVVAPGSNIVSARNESTGTGWGIYDAHYLYMGGTSMATPLVAGASAIVREFFDVNYSVDPGSALVKATLINGARDMTPGQYGAGSTQDVVRRPDINQGWGRVDLANSLIHESGREFWFHEDDGLDTGESVEFMFTVTGNSSPVRFTLAWVDYYGTEASNGALVNDIDLVVEDPNGMILLGNEVLVGGPDRTNNVETVDIANPDLGVYTVTVSGFNVPEGPQPFALVISGELIEGGEPDFALQATPSNLAICSGEVAEFAIGVRSIQDFEDQVELSLTAGQPGGTTAAFSVNPVVPLDPAAISVLSISDTGGLSSAVHALQISGESNGPEFPAVDKSVSVDLTVFGDVPAVGNLLLPANSAAGQSLTPTFEWEDFADAVEYRFQLSESPDFAVLIEDRIVSGTSLTLSDALDSSSFYFWRVAAANVCGDGGFSTIFAFSTEGLPGDCPVGTVADNLMMENFDGGALPGGWNTDGSSGAVTWVASTAQTHSGSHSMYAQNITSVSDQRLATPAVSLPNDAVSLFLNFQNWQHIESRSAGGCWDGGILEISTNGGGSWAQVSDDQIVFRDYDGAIGTGFGNPLQGQSAWCGDPRDFWERYTVDLSNWAGQDVNFRFRLGTDSTVGREGWYVDSVNVRACLPADTHKVGGEVSGLEGSGLVLQNNGADDLLVENDGPFEFDTELFEGQSYWVTVATQPVGPMQTCTVTDGVGTVPDAAVTDVMVDCVTDTFLVGGTVSGLEGSGLVLQNNGGGDLVIGGNGSFQFAVPVDDGGSYLVTVAVQPENPLQVCTVNNGSGTVDGADVTDIAVDCEIASFTLGGTVSGLQGTGLVLGNGSDMLPIAANGPFTFPTAITQGESYDVLVVSQPDDPLEFCQVEHGSGLAGTVDINDVMVECELRSTDIFHDRFELND